MTGIGRRGPLSGIPDMSAFCTAGELNATVGRPVQDLYVRADDYVRDRWFTLPTSTP